MKTQAVKRREGEEDPRPPVPSPQRCLPLGALRRAPLPPDSPHAAHRLLPPSLPPAAPRAGSRAGRRGLPHSDPLTSVPPRLRLTLLRQPVTEEMGAGLRHTARRPMAARSCQSRRSTRQGWRSGSRTEKGERQYPAPKNYSSRRALRGAHSLRLWAAGRAGHAGTRSSFSSPSSLAAGAEGSAQARAPAEGARG